MSESDKDIDQAFVHIEVENKKFFVRGIAIAGTGKSTQRKWYLFAAEDQVPSSYPSIESIVNKLRVKNFRNLLVNKDKLAPYLSQDKKSFEFKGIALLADSEKSINENGKRLLLTCRTSFACSNV